MPNFGFEKQYMPKQQKPLPPPQEEYKDHILELGGNDDEIIKMLRRRTEEFKALMDFNVETQDDPKGLSSNRILLPEQQRLIAEIITSIGMLGKELKNQSALISSLKDGNIEPIDALLPSYYKLFPEKNPSPRSPNDSDAPTEL